MEPAPHRERPHANGVRILLVALAGALLTEGLWRAGFLGRAETVQSDAWHRLRGHEDHPDDVVMIRVDDATLAHACCDDPFVFWAPVLAQAVGELRRAGSTVIGIDFLLKASAEGWLAEHGMDEWSRTWDGPLYGELLQGGVVLVGSTRRAPDGQMFYDLPIGPYQATLGPRPIEGLGIDNLVLDRDSVVRRFQPCPVIATDASDTLLSFAMVLALRHRGLPIDGGPWTLGDRTVSCDDAPMPIAWDGPPRAHAGIPLWRVVTGLSDEERAQVRGRIAIIGADYAGTTDVFPTPYDAREGELRMPGAEVHANIVHTLLGERHVRMLSDPVRLLALVLACGALSGALFRLSFRRSLVGLVGYELVLPPIGYLAFDRGEVLLPASSLGLAGLLVAGGAYGVRFWREERERRFLRSVFARYVSDAVVEDILSSPHGLGLGGARRDVTVLFSDIQGFTTMSERLSPEEVVEMLNEYFGRVCHPILEQGGVVDKFVGDAVMAIFGAPVAHPDHARRAVAAALAMSVAVDGFKKWMAERFRGRDLPPFDVGVGIHTGPAVAGNIGFERRTEYTVIGDTVNVAARVEGLTRKVGCRILVTRQVLLAVGNGLETGRSVSLPVKGRDREVEVFEVRALDGVVDASLAARPAGLDEDTTGLL